MIQVVGGGLAGCEAAWRIASRGLPVTLHEMRPVRSTPVHKTDRLAELVCSNSFRGAAIENAVGLLKEEMRRLDSLIMRVADATRVPAGGALAVDRERFACGVTGAIEQHPLIRVVREEVPRIPSAEGIESPVVIATGPLTSEALSAEIAALVGQDHLYFYDAISPVVSAESIDRSKAFRASRWDESSEGDYLNCPLDRKEYERLHAALAAAELAEVRDFDRARFFEGCLPVEVMARRGPETLRFGPIKPVGLTDPATGRRPYAVVQLRQDDLAADHYSLVGFQTQLRWGEQRRVLQMIPGLERGEFVRYGMIHRNTYVNAPAVLLDTWQTRARPDLLFAGQISGVEGYVESAASGLMAGINAAALAQGLPAAAPPRTTAMGALAYYVSHAAAADYQPTNMTFGLIPSPDRRPRSRRERRRKLAERALDDLAGWRGAAAAEA